MHITWRDFSGEGEGWNKDNKEQGRRVISSHKIDGERKNGMGNRELKEFICTTRRHELRVGDVGGSRGAGQRGDNGGKLGKL